MIQGYIFRYQVDRVADNRSRKYLENIGDHNEQDPRYQPPSVFVKEFIEVSEALHGYEANVGFLVFKSMVDSPWTIVLHLGVKE